VGKLTPATTNKGIHQLDLLVKKEEQVMTFI
jgi:hypothetical protein